MTADKVSRGIKEGKIKVKDVDEVFKRLGIDVQAETIRNCRKRFGKI